MTRIYNFSPITNVLLATVFGICMWGIQGYIFGYANIRWMTYFYIIFFFLFIDKRIPNVFLVFKNIKQLIEKNRLISSLMFVGLIIQLLPVFGSGLKYSDGVRFFGVNSADGIMHLAFIQSIAHHFPPIEPGAFDHPITNYHYWSDMVIADLARVWHIPIPNLFFQYVPIVISILTGIVAYKVVRIFGFSRIAGIWSLFFLYFGGDMAYFLHFLAHRTISFDAPALDNGAVQFLNMPHAMAKLVFLTSLIPLHYWLKTRKSKWGIMMITMFATMVGLKIYFGLFASLGFSLIVVGYLIQNYFRELKKNGFFSSLKSTLIKTRIPILFVILLGISSFLIYYPPNHGSGGLGWYPLEWPKIFLGPDGLNWGDWWLRHQVYSQARNIRDLWILDIIAIIIALFSIHGTRLIGFIPGRGYYKKLGWEKLLFFIPGVLLFHFLGLYTLQISGGFNVYNFFVVSTVVLSLFSAFLLSEFSFSKNILKDILIILIVLITIPRVISEATHYIGKYSHIKDSSTLVSNDEIQALNFIENDTPPSSIIQSHPSNHLDSNSPYVSFFTNRLTFLTGVGMQQTHNQPLDKKEKELKEIFSSDHSQELAERLRKYHINYLYFQKTPEQKIPFNFDPNLLPTVFENNSVIIVKNNLK